ncbi:MAG: hypothetical protein JSR18_06525 [Proteobacteria bacterium]|nr:hypothetical protein [Pseudomonadota bacterium]
MKRSKKIVVSHKVVVKPRNPVARSPLLGKSGPHDKTTAAKRRGARVALARTLRDPATYE